MKTWTVDEMMKSLACYSYPRERLVKLWAGRESLSVAEIAALDIPVLDKIELLLTTGPHVAPAVERITTRAIKNAYDKCQIPEWKTWADKWMSGEDRSKGPLADAWELVDAKKESEYASLAATRAAAWESWSAALESAEWSEPGAGPKELHLQLADILAVVEEQSADRPQEAGFSS